MNPRNKVRLTVERLEGRELLAGSVLSAGVLTIRGTAWADRVVVRPVAGGQVRVRASGGFREVSHYAAADVNRIVFVGGAGGDTFANRTGIASRAVGGPNDDILTGGGGNDTLLGGGGFDRLVGGGGTDTLSPGPQPTGSGSTTLSADQRLILNMTNGWRRSHGVAPLRLDPALQAIAQAHAANMARLDKYGDNDQNGHILFGHDFVWRLQQAGYQWTWAGENVAYNFGYSNPAQTLANQWWNSAGHRQNMLASQYTAVGIGVARGASGRTYGVQLFARPA